MSRSLPHGAVQVVCRQLWRGLVWLVQATGFVAGVADELVTAWIGCAPVLPRLRRWRRLIGTEWRAYRAGAIEGELMDGVWR